ncbi:MAG: polysaccharide biosynthesis C-terminal domain-containing protein [Candidatus Sericytochromatia bacterium]|nr:polysaccharide biosynthesis C-terminal domain-containing protein [Candidatus Sericytochromatia bacterium]
MKDIKWLILSVFISTLITLVFAYKKIKPLLNLDSPSSLHHQIKLIQYGYKAHLSNILAFLNYKADIFLVNFFLGPASTGVYIVAVQIAERLWMLSQAAGTILLPHLSSLNQREDERAKITPVVTRMVLFVTFLGAIFIAVIGFVLLHLLFGHKFRPSFAPLLLLLPGMVLGAASRILANDIASRGKPEINMYSSLIVIIVNIIGNIVLIPEFGLSGAALATSIAYSVNFGFRLLSYWLFTHARIKDVLIIQPQDFFVLKAKLQNAIKPRGPS